MKNSTTIRFLAAAMIVGTNGCDSGTTSAVGEAGSLYGEATDALRADLPILRQEEKLARDVYLRLGDLWGVPIFDNIASSEQRHTDAVRVLLEALVIDDPIVDDTVGVLPDASLTALYEQLVAAGSVSEVEAYRVGATVEDLDIADIRAWSRRTVLPEALAVYASLECGSRNHLRSFVARLEAAGETYVASHLTQAEVDEILAGSHESCGQ
jgi:hypothetical protein